MTVEHPVRRILEATQRLTRGDFSARIQPFHGLDGMNEFDAIINDFNKMAAELSGIETLRTDFVANVSHELKTPLAVIQNYAVMLQDPGFRRRTGRVCRRHHPRHPPPVRTYHQYPQAEQAGESADLSPARAL